MHLSTRKGNHKSTMLGERVLALDTSDADQWAEVLDEIGVYDTYHLPAYHRLAELNGEGKAVMLVYREHDCAIAFPMLIRNIEFVRINRSFSDFRDVTSVYGYPGPVASRRDISCDAKQRFAAVLQDYFEANNIICAFTRLNPIIDNAYILRGCGEIVDVGSTVSVDLRMPSSLQYASYRRCHKRDIEALKDKGFICSEAGKEALDDFYRVYVETMERNNADSYYRFDKSYFAYILNEMPNEAHLFICRKDNIIVSGMIAFACNGIVHGHLGGTLNEYARLAPMKLTYDGVRRWANALGAHTFHLGGGVACREDSLLFYKRGFGNQEHTFSVWRLPVSPQVCDELYSEMCRVTQIVPKEQYFPPYRSPAFLKTLNPNSGEQTEDSNYLGLRLHANAATGSQHGEQT